MSTPQQRLRLGASHTMRALTSAASWSSTALCFASPCVKRWVGASRALIAVLALVACGNDEPVSPPKPPLEVQLAIPWVFVSRDTIRAPNKVSCVYYIGARAAGGRRGDSSSWVGGESVWTFASGGSEASTWSQADVFDFFGFNLTAGAITSGLVRDRWLPPYTVTHHFRYRVEGGDE